MQVYIEGSIKAMLAIEEGGKRFLTRASYEFFQSNCWDIQFSLLQFLKVRTTVCNSENISTQKFPKEYNSTRNYSK